MELAAGIKPIVWEINASSEEMFIMEPFVKSSSVHFRLLDRFLKFRHEKKLQISIGREESFRKNLAKKVHAAICVSEELSQYAVKGLGITEFKVIPNGSDPTLFSPEKKKSDLFKDYDNRFKVIYIGDSQYPWQGFEIITQLATKSKNEHRDILFVVLDNSPIETQLEQNNLVVFRAIDYFDVPTFVASADLCLCLYHDFRWSAYGFTLSPLKLFDYMASGRPVIASRLGQIASVIEDGKDGLLTTNDIHDIYGKILFCLEHNDKAQEIGRSARQKVVRYYNWERAAKSTIELFTALM
jgi:glycosyltransferase involved in cell wall biosynthesis